MSNLIFRLAVAGLIYILSVILHYNWVKSAYSKGGIKESEDISQDELVVTFTPFANTFFSLGWIFMYPRNREDRQTRAIKFFNIKRDNDDSKD